jgi:hypothetical protein
LEQIECCPIMIAKQLPGPLTDVFTL